MDDNSFDDLNESIKKMPLDELIIYRRAGYLGLVILNSIGLGSLALMFLYPGFFMILAGTIAAFWAASACIELEKTLKEIKTCINKFDK